MCKELEDELARGDEAAKALVQHMHAMGGPSHVDIPLTVTAPNGDLEEWMVTAKLISRIKEV